jgi:WD40 repeat protein
MLYLKKLYEVKNGGMAVFFQFQKCLIQSFADHSHRASIRSVCANGKFVASGSADETIHVYDMEARRESGILVHHSGKARTERMVCSAELNSRDTMKRVYQLELKINCCSQTNFVPSLHVV